MIAKILILLLHIWTIVLGFTLTLDPEFGNPKRRIHNGTIAGAILIAAALYNLTHIIF